MLFCSVFSMIGKPLGSLPSLISVAIIGRIRIVDANAAHRKAIYWSVLPISPPTGTEWDVTSKVVIAFIFYRYFDLNLDWLYDAATMQTNRIVLLKNC